MKQRHWSLVGLLCLQLLTVACAKPTPQKVEPAKPPVTALAWLPAESQVVAKVTLAPWRNTPVWSLWEENQSKANAFPTWLDVGLVDELAIGGELGANVPAEGEPKGSFVAAVKGRFGEGYLAKLAARDQSPVEKHGAWSFYTMQDLRWLQTAADVIVVCSPDRADFVAARATEGGETVPAADRSLMRSLAERLNVAGADLALMAEDNSGQGKSELEKRGAQLGLSPLARDLVRAGLSIDMGSTVQLSLAAETPDAESAQRLKLNVDETLSMFSRNMFVGLLGLRPLVAALKASQEGSHVTVRGALAEADVSALLSKAASMLEMAAQGGGAPRLAP
jgi:hypothetical protein